MSSPAPRTARELSAGEPPIYGPVLLYADRSIGEAADKYRAMARNYLDALALFMMPGSLGELADQL